MSSQKIGIFDSGLGGLTVLDSIHKILPNENLVYFGDTARVPYGNKSKATIIQYSKEIYQFLLTKNIKALVVGCNTASSYALHVLKRLAKIPIFGVIEPGIQATINLIDHKDIKKIAVIATKATIQSNSYLKVLKQYNQNLTLYQKACPLFVPLIEENFMNKPVMQEIIKEYINEIQKKNIHYVILGCTHYPIIKLVLNKIYPKINFIDSSLETAKFVQKKLMDMKLLNNKPKIGSIKMYVSDITKALEDLQYLFLKKRLKIEKKNLDW